MESSGSFSIVGAVCRGSSVTGCVAPWLPSRSHGESERPDKPTLLSICSEFRSPAPMLVNFNTLPCLPQFGKNTSWPDINASSTMQI